MVNTQRQKISWFLYLVKGDKKNRLKILKLSRKKAIVIKIDDTQKPTKLPGLNKILWRKKMKWTT